MSLAEREGDLQRVVNEFYSVCKRRKLKVNDGKSKVMVFERREEEVVDFKVFLSFSCYSISQWVQLKGKNKGSRGEKRSSLFLNPFSTRRSLLNDTVEAV